VKHGATLSFLAVALVLAACSSAKDNDQPQEAGTNPLGNGQRLRDIQDPTVDPDHASGPTVFVSGVVVTAIDDFDETHNGKSRGTIFVQDADEAKPYGGISMYAPTFTPANLRLAPGDVINMTGQYAEQSKIGTTVDFSPDFLPQMSKPQVDGTEQFEVQQPTPIEVTVDDLSSFDKARPYLGMLVVIKDITVPNAPAPTDSSGRVGAAITTIGPTINNELWDLQPWNGSNSSNSFPQNTHFSQIIGVVDFFFNIFICPRSAADLVQ